MKSACVAGTSFLILNEILSHRDLMTNQDCIMIFKAHKIYLSLCHFRNTKTLPCFECTKNQLCFCRVKHLFHISWVQSATKHFTTQRVWTLEIIFELIFFYFSLYLSILEIFILQLITSLQVLYFSIVDHCLYLLNKGGQSRACLCNVFSQEIATWHLHWSVIVVRYKHERNKFRSAVKYGKNNLRSRVVIEFNL